MQAVGRQAARIALSILFVVLGSAAAAEPAGLLFRMSADHGLTADVAAGEAAPNFADKVSIENDPVVGPYVKASGDQVLSWHAPGNIYAQRGTLSFLWRARDPLGRTAFPLFRVGYADHSSWDMTWLRMDWNGHGFDAFVTDANLSRVRVSYAIPATPRPGQWLRIAFAWDEISGVRLFVDGKPVAARDQTAVLDAGLDQFGPHSRIISPHQVQSAYSYLRGGDITDIRIWDHMLTAAELLDGASTPPGRDLMSAAATGAWRHRYGWDGAAPPYLADASTRIRKVEIADAWDLKERMNGANDGIAETTWPGVYNRSRLPGRDDYFELPDWNVYVEGGRSVTFDLPNEAWNRLEFIGAAQGSLTWSPPGGASTPLAERPSAVERTVHALAEHTGGRIRFDNVLAETPIQEVGVYEVAAGGEPADDMALSYQVHVQADPAEYPTLDPLTAFIAGRFVTEERSTVVALPKGAPQRPRATSAAPALPIVHILVPADLRLARPGEAVGHYSYGWENLDAGLDGVAIDLPALSAGAAWGGLIPLNIQIKDPLWPARDLMDVSVSVKPGEARTLWLDTRDRLPPPGASLYLTIASAAPDFNAAQLDGMVVRLRFKPRTAALPEHVADRLAQARDNLAFLVEEHDNSRRLARFDRLDLELTDLLRADPENRRGREMWAELNPEQPWPAVSLPSVPAGVPAWAFLQTQDLKRVRQYIDWWIDNRQAAFGDFGGGISDDDDLTQQWPPLALMGDEPDKVTRSLSALADAVRANGMITNGLGTLKTDELHSYEEGLNAESQAMYLQWGDPRTVERLMETVRAYPRITAGRDGHVHIASSFFSATDVTTEGIWGWSKPYSNLILHPGIMLSEFNGDGATRRLIIALADSYVAHGRQNAAGAWSFPEEINATTEQARGTLTAGSRGNVAAQQLFWAAWRWTGDARFLRPLEAEIAAGDVGELAELNANVIDELGHADSWGAALKARTDRTGDKGFPAFEAWQLSGDTRYLERIYADEIATAEHRMWLVTEAHWWSDRVELFSDLLQRSRLGGMALRRNQTFPGHAVSWRFDQPTAAESVGVLLRGATRTHLSVIAYNLSDRPIGAVMTGWDIAPGVWRLRQAVEGGTASERTLPFERSAGIDLSFPPGKTTTLEMDLVTSGAPVEQRADLGMGPYDLRRAGRSLSVTVHSLGAKTSSPTWLVLVGAGGRELGRAPIPAVAPPSDLLPKTVVVTLPLPRTGPAAGLRVRILPAAGAPEITLLNNEAALP